MLRKRTRSLLLGTATPESSDSRFEYRGFAHGFREVESAIRKTAECRETVESQDTYLVGPRSDDVSVKIRDDRLSIKSRIQIRGHLELWQPVLEEPFPLPRDLVLRALPEALGIRGEELVLERARLRANDLIEAIRRPHLDIIVGDVFKRRSFYEVLRCRTEIDEVLVTGQAIRSVAVESVDAEQVEAAVVRIGLDRYPNCSFSRAIREIARRPTSIWT